MERTYVTGSSIADELHDKIVEIEYSFVYQCLDLTKGNYILLMPIEKITSIQRRTLLPYLTLLIKWQGNTTYQSCIDVTQEVAIVL